PAAAHAHLKVEEDLAAQLALELLAGARADLLDLAAACADQDPLLGVGLGPDLGAHLNHAVGTLCHLLNLDLDGMWELVPGAAKDLLADQLSQQHLAGKIGALFGWEEKRALRQQRHQLLDQRLEPPSRPGADGEDLVDDLELPGRREHGGGL